MIRWGIIGCGQVTEVKSGPAFQRVSGSRLHAVMRRNGKLAEDYARRHGVPKWYDRAEDLINDPEVDAVYVATPPGTHAYYALKVCEAGKPAYVEKPMARHAGECLQMVEAFRERGLPRFVAYYRRGLPRFLKAKSLLEDGAIGKVTGVLYRYHSSHHRNVNPENLPWRLDATEAGGGLFLDLGSHTLDILDFMLGPLAGVSGHAANVASPCAVEDTVSMAYTIQGGIPGVAHWNFATDQREDLIEIYGTDGSLRMSTFGDDPVVLQRSGKTTEFAHEAPKHIQEPLIQTIVDDLLGRGKCVSTGDSGMRTSIVMDRVLSTYYGGREDAFWERSDQWPGRLMRA